MTLNQNDKNPKISVEDITGSVCTGGNCSSPIRPYTSSDRPAERSSILDFKGFWRYFLRMPDLKIIVLGWILLLGTLLLDRLGLSNTAVLILQFMILPIAGWMVFRNGAISLFKEHNLNMNVLMSVASIGAVAIGEAHEALIMVILFTLSEALEGYTNDHARAILTEFADLAPHQALLTTSDGDQLVPIEDLKVDDRILVRAGERFRWTALSSGVPARSTRRLSPGRAVLCQKSLVMKSSRVRLTGRAYWRCASVIWQQIPPFSALLPWSRKPRKTKPARRNSLTGLRRSTPPL
jgi:hypothetical protein